MVREGLRSGEASSIEHGERVPSERWYQVRIGRAEGVASDRDSGACFLLTFRDITEARRMDRMRSDFVANASHELRTPLASLTGFLETLQGPARDDPKARDRFLAIMLDQAERMSRLIDDLMSLSRLELRSHVAPAGTVELQPLLAHVCDTLRPLAAELGVTIRFEASATDLKVRGDRDELIQVFQNLIENACKYGQSGGAVDVSLIAGGTGDTPQGVIDVAVRDYGPGIAPEHVPRLTERFYRADVETSRSKKGTGLGLAIVKHILTRHRARLMIRSQPGHGSVFAVRFAAC
jgi:two-component system phosphate regulon sensor histidine kinase PhoR